MDQPVFCINSDITIPEAKCALCMQTARLQEKLVFFISAFPHLANAHTPALIPVIAIISTVIHTTVAATD